MIVTREWMCEYIRTQPDHKVATMIGKALVALFKRQTEDERVVERTKHLNNIGFSALDAKAGSIGAKTFMKYGRFLEDWQWKMWVKPNARGIPRIAKYHRQLNEIAQERAG